jgi:hypothetical protein
MSDLGTYADYLLPASCAAFAAHGVVVYIVMLESHSKVNLTSGNRNRDRNASRISFCYLQQL